MDETNGLVQAGLGEERWSWSVSIADAIQTFAIRYALDGPDRLPALDEFIGSLPPPRDVPESLVFDGLVGKLRDRCAVAVRAWMAERAASHLRSHYSKPLDLALLSRVCRVRRRGGGMVRYSQRTLRRCFREAFGLTIRQFQARLRVRKALQLVAGGDKVCVSALAAGYKTEKDLCRVVRRIAGITPAAVRGLGAEELQTLLAALVPQDDRRPNSVSARAAPGASAGSRGRA